MKNYRKNILSITVFFSVVLACCASNKNKPVTTIIDTPYVYIETDTIYLNSDFDIYSGFIYSNKVYAYLYEKGVCKLAVFDESGVYMKTTEFQKEIEREWMLNYAVKDNKLYIIENGRDINMHFIDPGSEELRLSSSTEIPVYDDNEYLVYKTSHGEWGGMVYFREKITDKIFRAYSNRVINVNKFNGAYYVTSYLGHMMGHSQIVKISDPKQMQEYNGSLDAIANNRAESGEKERYVFDGIENVIDTFSLRTVGSFIHKDRLLQLWNEHPRSDKLYFTELIDSELQYRYIFEQPMYVKYLYNYGLNNNTHILSFEIRNEDKKGLGIIEINNERIRIRFLMKNEGF